MSTGSSNVGAVVSCIVKVASVVLVFPQSSVAVNTTSKLPLAPQVVARSSVKLFVHVTGPLQTSEALAPALLFNQA